MVDLVLVKDHAHHTLVNTGQLARGIEGQATALFGLQHKIRALRKIRAMRNVRALRNVSASYLEVNVWRLGVEPNAARVELLCQQLPMPCQ